MRYIVMFSIIFVVSGVIFVSGSLFVVPYSVLELVEVDWSKTWANDTFTLMSFENRTFILDSLVENSSTIQVDLDSSDFVAFKIINRVNDRVRFETESRWDVTFYWTQPLEGYGSWRFVFHNPSSSSVNVTAKITEFYHKWTEYRNVEYYRSFFDPLYGYIGIISILAGTALNVVHVSREAKRRN